MDVMWYNKDAVFFALSFYYESKTQSSAKRKYLLPEYNNLQACET